jgi:cell division septation protein DedD
MRRFTLLLLAALPAAARAQPPADSAVYARARQLVTDGDAAAGRAVVDSMLAAAAVGTPAYAEALYWRATLAERSSDAERDYRRLAVEYGTSPRGADALIRLAQLDLVRGQVPAARTHLERLLRDHTDPASQARGRYWLARAHLGAGNPGAACGALDAAAMTAPQGSEVARQIAALRPRVTNCETFLARRPAPATPAPVAPTTTAPTTPAPGAAATVPVDSAPRPAAPAARGARQFTIQVAAYDRRPGAEALAESLTRRGWPARVAAPNGDRPPFRVRVGRFATRDEANAIVRQLRAQKIPALLTDAEPES